MTDCCINTKYYLSYLPLGQLFPAHYFRSKYCLIHHNKNVCFSPGNTRRWCRCTDNFDFSTPWRRKNRWSHFIAGPSKGLWYTQKFYSSSWSMFIHISHWKKVLILLNLLWNVLADSGEECSDKSNKWWVNEKVKLQLCKIYWGKGMHENFVDTIFPLIRKSLYIGNLQHTVKFWKLNFMLFFLPIIGANTCTY